MILNKSYPKDLASALHDVPCFELPQTIELHALVLFPPSPSPWLASRVPFQYETTGRRVTSH